MSIDLAPFRCGFNTATKPRKFDELKAALVARAEDVCRHLYPNGRRKGNEWCVGSVNGEPGKSFQINLKTGIHKEFADDGPGGNDLIALWAVAKDIKQGAAYDEAAAWVGFDTGKPKTAPDRVPSPVPMKPTPPAPVEEDEEDFWWLKVKPKKWEYVDADGVVWATVRRWDRPGEKRVRPWDHKSESEKWPEGLRPLFNLGQIKTAPDPIILVEGEKCADALVALGYTGTTCAGGSSAVRVTDWSQLKGRNVVRWADNDAAGRKWLEDTRGALEAAGVHSIRDVAIPAGKRVGWDCANAEADEVRALIEGAGTAAAEEEPITCIPAVYPDLDKIEKRRFIYDTVYQRGTVTVSASAGGIGKSILHVVEALSITTGRDLLQLGKKIERCPVWMISLEDDETEVHRRIGAARVHYGIDLSDIGDRLFITPSKAAPKFLLARADRDGFQVSHDVLDRLAAEITRNNIGVTMLDPYVYAHEINENDNMGQGQIVRALGTVADKTKSSIAIVHHAKKPAANDRDEASSSDIRGASAIPNASRHSRLLVRMSQSDADKMGVERSQRYYYFHTSSAKGNYEKPGPNSRWYFLKSTQLPDRLDGEDADGAGVVTRWRPPDAFEVIGVTVDTLMAVQAEVARTCRADTPYRLSEKTKSGPWIGELIADKTGLDPSIKEERAKIFLILRTWLNTGALIVDREWSDGHQKRPIIRSGPAA